MAGPDPGHHEGVSMSESHPGSEQPGPEQPGPEQPGAHQSGPEQPAARPGSARPGVGDLLTGKDRLDLATVAVGLLALLASFLPYYTMSFDGFEGFGGASESASAWHGFFGWFGAVCALAAAAVLAAHLLGVALPVPVRLVVLALFGLALVCTLLALFVYPGESCEDAVGGFMTKDICDSFDEGRGVGYWLALISTAAGTALAAMRRSAA